MRTVWKYTLENVNIQKIKMPRTADILHVAVQAGVPCLWAEVTPDTPEEERTILILGTGHVIPPWTTRRYIGTFQLQDGVLIFHVYEMSPV